MKLSRLLIIFLLAGTSAFAEQSPVTDSEALTGLLTESLRSMLGEPGLCNGKKAAVTFSPIVSTTPAVRRAVEAVLTDMGASITEDAAFADMVVGISITDARVVLSRNGDEWNRFAALTVHVECTDSDTRLLLAQHREKTFQDRIDKRRLDRTDDLTSFSRGAQRKMPETPPSKLRCASFLLLTGLIAYFAFK
ncbi:MAG: hypothetical protein J7M24_07575 [Candidatus Latescibacteria bacterium]|nr:hypothetical protein [Candidatus Latescibacterota bacterium]